MMCFIVITILLTDCRSKKVTEQKVKPQSLAISGDLADYLRIVDNEYEISQRDVLNLNFSVRLTAIKPIDTTKLMNKDINLIASILDETGMPISGIQFNLDSHDQLLSLLKKGSGEEIIQMSAVVLQDLDLSKIQKFSISSTVKEKEKEAVDNSSSTDTSSANADTGLIANNDTGSPNDYDKMLDSYEKNTNDYIKLVQSMQKDDADAVINNYADVLQSSLDLQQKLKNVKSKLTQKQASRLIHIEMKLAKAMVKANSQK